MRISKKNIAWLLFLFISIKLYGQQQPGNTGMEGFDIINLNYPGLEKVNKAAAAGNYDEAAKEMLAYYRKKASAKEPDFSNAEKPVSIHDSISVVTLETADKALLHQFQPHKGYGFFDYGKDINWQNWPVKDNEVLWQLHRVKWWQAMALVYQKTKDERYAREWMLQFADWVQKNKPDPSASYFKYAWRPLEVSDRIQGLAPTFSIFVHSKSFTPEFLMEFLKSYHQQTDYLPANYAKLGNHRLFEAQRVLFAGASFPEFKNAGRWRESGISVLNTEIKKQVYPDGMQFELSPVYHVAAIDIFLKAYRSAKNAGLEKEFPVSYIKTVENMILAAISISFPDYNTPMFGDSWNGEKKRRIEQFASWSKIFPYNETIKYFATDREEGKQPDFLSKGLSTAGFYTFRNGWESKSTVLILKASPPGEFHAQPDNGTFELWVNGRNFTPDAGTYVYSGDAEIMKKRDWYRQSRVHNTLTLDNQNMIITDAHQDKWETSKTLDILTYTNPSYKSLNHERSVLFIDRKYFLIIDRALGKATGNLGVHFQLKEDSNPVFDKTGNKVYTTYADGNNLVIQNLNNDKISLKEEEGKVSYVYQEEMTRPAFVFEKAKNADKTQSFVTILYPFEGTKAPAITIRENEGNDYDAGNLNITLTINNLNKIIKVKTK